MLDAKRGLLAECANRSGKYYLYKKDSMWGDNYQILAPVVPTALKAENDEEAIKWFARYCGVRLDEVKR